MLDEMLEDVIRQSAPQCVRQSRLPPRAARALQSNRRVVRMPLWSVVAAVMASAMAAGAVGYKVGAARPPIDPLSSVVHVHVGQDVFARIRPCPASSPTVWRPIRGRSIPGEDS